MEIGTFVCIKLKRYSLFDRLGTSINATGHQPCLSRLQSRPVGAD